MKIAVLIPCYNVEKYLAECLDSVLAAGAQLSTFNFQPSTSLSIFCCDDGSKDGTLEILKHYSSEHPEVHYVTQPNAGVSAARNRLLDELPSEFDAFAFVDADDTVQPEIYVKLVEAMERTRSDIAECLWDGEERIINDLSVYLVRRTAPGNFAPIFTKLYQRSACGKVRFHEVLAHEEDYFYGMEMHVAIKRKVLVPGMFYNYRMNPDSVCNKLNHRKYFDSACTRVRLSISEFLEKGKVPEQLEAEFRADLTRDAYRMIVHKNLKKNKDPVLRRQLSREAAAFFRDPKIVDNLSLSALSLIQRVVLRILLLWSSRLGRPMCSRTESMVRG